MNNIISFEDRRKYADVNKALSNFYEETVEQVSRETKVSQKKIRRWFGGTLITSSGIRAQVNRGKSDAGGLPNEAADLFLAEHLIRNEGTRGGQWYELAHDRLIEPVLNSNTEWFEKNLNAFERQVELWKNENRSEKLLFSEQQMEQFEDWVNEHKDNLTRSEQDFWNACLDAREEAEQERLELAEAAERERKEKKRYQIYSLVFTSLFIIATASLGYAYYVNSKLEDEKLKVILANGSLNIERNQAVTDKETAEAAKRKAVEAEVRARIAETEALKLRDIADKMAIEQKQLADKEKGSAMKADVEREKAEIAKTQAVEAQIIAEKAKVAAVTAQEGLKTALGMANKEKDRAEKFKALGETYKDTYDYISKDDSGKTLSGFQNILEKYNEIEDEKFKKEGRRSTYIALGETNIRIVKNRNPRTSLASPKAVDSYKEALFNYTEALKLSPTQEVKTPTQIKVAETNENLGKLFNDLLKPSDAINSYENAALIYKQLKQEKKAIAAFFQAGKIYHKANSSNKENEENKYFDSAISIYPSGSIDRARMLVEIGKFYTGYSSEYRSIEDVRKIPSINQEDKKRAINKFNEAIDIYQTNFNKEKLTLVDMVSILVSLANIVPDSQQRITYYERAMKTLEKDSGKSPEMAFVGYVGVARDYQAIQNYDEAIKNYEQAIKILERLQLTEGKNIMLINIGKIYLSFNREKAGIYFEQAIESYNADSDPAGTAWALIAIGKAHLFLNTDEMKKQADTYFERARQVYQKKQDRLGEAYTLLEICNSKYEELLLLKQCFQATEKSIGDKDYANKALVRFKIGELYVTKLNEVPFGESNGDEDTAIEYFSEAVEDFNKINDHLGKSLALVRRGSIYEEFKSDKEKALKDYEKALEIQTEKDNKTGKARVLVEIGSYSKLTGEEKFSYLKKALDIYKELPNKDIDGEAKAYTGILHAFYGIGSSNEEINSYIQKALKFYETNLSEISYVIDTGYPESTVCFLIYRTYNPDSWKDFYKRVSEKLEKQTSIQAKSIEDYRKKQIVYTNLGQIYSSLDDRQKSKFNYWFAAQLGGQPDISAVTIDDYFKTNKLIETDPFEDELYEN